MRPGSRSIGRIRVPSPPAGKYSTSAPSFYVMEVFYVDEEGNRLDQPPTCWYVMEDSVPPTVKKVCSSPDDAEAYVLALHEKYGRG